MERLSWMLAEGFCVRTVKWTPKNFPILLFILFITDKGAVAKWQIWRFLQKIILIFQRLFVRRITKRAILQQRPNK